MSDDNNDATNEQSAKHTFHVEVRTFYKDGLVIAEIAQDGKQVSVLATIVPDLVRTQENLRLFSDMVNAFFTEHMQRQGGTVTAVDRKSFTENLQRMPK